MERNIVTVFGSSQPRRGSSAYKTAYELGKTIGLAGWTLCNGGYGGTMEAGASGAVAAGGNTIGVTCSVFGRARPNAYIRQEVPTFDLLQRLNTLIRLGRAYVVLPGGTGTLLELALTWELFNKGLVKRKAPLVLLGDHWSPVVECVLGDRADSIQPDVARDVVEARQILDAHFGVDGDA